MELSPSLRRRWSRDRCIVLRFLTRGRPSRMPLIGDCFAALPTDEGRASTPRSVVAGSPSCFSSPRLSPRPPSHSGSLCSAGAWVTSELVLPRRRAVPPWQLARPSATIFTGRARVLARRSFQHLGMNLAEVCVLLFRPRSVALARLELAGHEHIDKAAAEGKGVLLLSAHLGNWELFAAAHALTSFELSVVVRPLDDPLLHRLASAAPARGVGLIGNHRGWRRSRSPPARPAVGVLLARTARG